MGASESSIAAPTPVGTASASGPARERGEDTRRRILDVAATAFAEKGYTGTSLNELIRATGLTKGGFYFHFRSKEELALAALEHKKEQWAGRVMSAAMREHRALDRCRAMAWALCDLYEQDPSFRAIGKLCMGLMDEAPELAPRLQPTFETWVDLTAGLIQAAQDEGDVRPDVDARVAAEHAVATFVGMEEMSFFGSGGTDLRRRVAGFLELFEAGLSPNRS
jgi:AcrR family transcriptional regulator